MEEKKPTPINAVVPIALMNDILSYLGTKPYTEVYPYITAIQANTKPIEEPTSDK